MPNEVVIAGHPGFVDEFRASLIPGLHNFTTPAEKEPVTVICTEAGEPLVVRSRYVFTAEGLAYAKEWAAVTGDSVFDVRIPEAFRVGA